MTARAPRELVIVAAAATALTLVGGVGAEAFGAPPTDEPTTTTTSSSTSTSSTSTSTTTTVPPTTTTTAPRDPVAEAIRRWFPDVEARARQIAACESTMNPRAVSPGGGNHGLFQINDVHRPQFRSVTGVAWAEGRYDPDANARFARWLYDREGWEPWACA